MAFKAGYGGLRISQMFEVNSGTMSSATNTQTTVAFTHGLGVAPINAFGIVRDGSWAGQVAVQWVSATSTTVTFTFTNRGPNAAQAIYRFQLVY